MSDKIDARSFLSRVERELGAGSASGVGLAAALGIEPARLSMLRKSGEISALQIARLVDSACKAAVKRSLADTITPVVEFFRIEKCLSRGEGKFELFSDLEENKSPHPYRSGVKRALLDAKGIYIFFDSRGRAPYVGKTAGKTMSLWSEMKNAFNRDRGDIQSIRRVNHPKVKKEFKRYDEKKRQILDVIVPLHEMAEYFSAYRVNNNNIPTIEAMLIRSFSNDLLNRRMENF